ncbi:hypothetical protein DNK47_00665 [Mycoplasma wenyonii]|uniref:Uncharacterized protein n=1 Tax=Mycoplasma wenyonii TaxID=65123 RepID=A0A328PSM6_9MOLU|nr:hypothetical protein [Mycoplasma wenyonii]RAO95347.1 hypothetical protein DNK47_00665 [Mycoplasma wenyonii]
MSWIAKLFYEKFKALFIVGSSIVGGGVIAVPKVIAGNNFEEYLFREFNPVPAKYDFSGASPVKVSDEGNGQYNKDQSKFSNFQEVKVSNAQLIKGTKSYNNGNYVIYFGSEACPNCNNFLYSENTSPKTWVGTDQQNLYSNGTFFETYSLAKHNNDANPTKLKDIKFVFFSDEVPSMENRNNDDLYTIPWNKWDSTLTSRGKVEGDYIRYDSSAVKFRKIQSLLFYYFGEKASGIPTIIIYRDGIPFVYGKDKLETIEKEKQKTGEQISSLQEAEAESSGRAVILRYDLIKHLRYIFDGEVTWWL